MSPGLKAAECRSCGAVYFPHRLICRACGGDRWTEAILADAVIEESTAVLHVAGAGGSAPRYLATVRTTAGPRLIVGLDAPVPDGSPVQLFDKDGAPMARPDG
jgi:uncharacterized OB-fold protein